MSDFHGLRQEPVHSLADLTLALNRLDAWLEEELIHEGIHIELQRWLGGRDFVATNEYIETIIQDQHADHYVTCAWLLSDRGFGDQDQRLWLQLLRASHATPIWRDISQRFVGTASFIRLVSGKMGQVPPALTGRSAKLQGMLEQVGDDEPHVARLLKDAIQYVEDDIERHRKREQEMLDPR